MPFPPVLRSFFPAILTPPWQQISHELSLIIKIITLIMFLLHKGTQMEPILYKANILFSGILAPSVIIIYCDFFGDDPFDDSPP